MQKYEINKIKTSIQSGKFDSYIKTDIENFYPSINHEILVKFLHRKTKKIEFTDLLIKSIKQETVSKSNSHIEKYSNNKGVPQGLSISNILASIYFIEFDKMHSSQINYEYYRYVDDILILCNKRDIPSVFKLLENDMNNLDLKIHQFLFLFHLQLKLLFQNYL